MVVVIIADEDEDVVVGRSGNGKTVVCQPSTFATTTAPIELSSIRKTQTFLLTSLTAKPPNSMPPQ